MLFYTHEIKRIRQTDGRQLQNCFSLVASGQSDTDNDLVDDCIAVITSMASRIYGRRTSKQRAEKIKACVESAMKGEEG